jgi:hypothetical protein
MICKGYRRGLLGVCSFLFLAGCSWFDGGDVAPAAKVRPGADRQIAPTGTLPAPATHRFEQGVAPVNESTPQVGSVVASKGGQKAQKDAAEKATADRDAKEREAREAAERAAKEQKATSPPVDAPATDEPTPAPPKS